MIVTVASAVVLVAAEAVAAVAFGDALAVPLSLLFICWLH